jgi:hypothetical protein
MQRRKRKSHHNKDNIQRKENRHSTAKIKENTRLIKHQHKNIYPIKLKNKLLQEEKIILPRHGCIRTNSEDCRKLEDLPLRKQSAD